MVAKHQPVSYQTEQVKERHQQSRLWHGLVPAMLETEVPGTALVGYRHLVVIFHHAEKQDVGSMAARIGRVFSSPYVLQIWRCGYAFNVSSEV
jgi:hypothetical protein